MKETSITIIVSIILLASQAKPHPFEGCVRVKDRKCVECYRRKPLHHGRSCGPLLPSEHLCVLYHRGHRNRVHCTSCRPGFALFSRMVGSEFLRTCIYGVIENCLDETHDQQGVKKCRMCRGRRYAIKVDQGFNNICVDILDPVENCESGGTAYTLRPKCGLCRYSYSAMPTGHRCVRTTNPGCMITSERRCLYCNPYYGFSMSPGGDCFRSEELTVKMA